MKDEALVHVNVTDSEIEKLMITFHLAPTIEVFNYVILSDGEMYRDDEPDRVDEFYIDYADEDWQARRARIRRLKKELAESKGKPVGTHRANYSNPLKLAWVCAAVKAFPWLIDECTWPLYIERAYKFTNDSLFDLTQQVAAGPVRNTIEKNIDRKNQWNERCKALARINLMRFGASGNHWYIDNMHELIGENSRGEYIFHMAVGDYQMDLYYTASINYEKFEPKEGATNLAVDLIRRAQGNFARVEIGLDVEVDDEVADEIDELFAVI